MRPLHDPPPAAALAERYALLRGLARRSYPSLSDHDLEDVVQETLVRVLERERRGPLDDPVSYAVRVVYTTGAAALRTRVRSVPTDPTDRDFGGILERGNRAAAPLTPEEQVLARFGSGGVSSLLATLDPNERWALTLRIVHAYEPEEIAAELGISVRAYRTLRWLALRKLTREMASADDAAPASVGHRAWRAAA